MDREHANDGPMERVYLDWNATAPPHPDVLAAMSEATRVGWANPSSVHADGRAARAFVEQAREALAALTAADARDVVFTGGGTEANNLAVLSAMRRPGKLVTSRLEHPSITRLAERFEAEDRTRWLRVAPDGRVDLEDLARALEESEVACVAIQAVNHETGVLQPFAEAAGAARVKGAWVHVDAVQAWGRLPAERLQSAPIDSASVAAHKMRGPKGIGALVIRTGATVHPVLLGGAQERGLRPGTVDAVAAAGFGAAARRAAEGAAAYERIRALRDQLEAELVALGGARNGAGPRAPHVSNVAFAAWSAPELVAAMDLEGVSISGGSACSAGTMEPSPVIGAMAGASRARGSIRVSLGESTSPAEVIRAVAAFRLVLARIR